MVAPPDQAEKAGERADGEDVVGVESSPDVGELSQTGFGIAAGRPGAVDRTNRGADDQVGTDSVIRRPSYLISFGFPQMLRVIAPTHRPGAQALLSARLIGNT